MRLLRTTIGQTLHDSPRLAIAGLIGALAVAADFSLEWWSKDLRYLNAAEGRGAVALFGLAAYVYLVQGDLKSLGLTLRPIQGWRYWVKATLLIGLAFAGIVAAGLGLLALCGSKHATTLRAMPPQFLGVAFLHMCVFAPVLEETLYRLLVCVPLAGWKRPRMAIAVSGVIFAALHFVYGNPGPENAVGGLFLAWAYLKSETIVVPVLLHALGNSLIPRCRLRLGIVWHAQHKARIDEKGHRNAFRSGCEQIDDPLDRPVELISYGTVFPRRELAAG